jgi:hypothetical protein
MPDASLMALANIGAPQNITRRRRRKFGRRSAAANGAPMRPPIFARLIIFRFHRRKASKSDTLHEQKRIFRKSGYFSAVTVTELLANAIFLPLAVVKGDISDDKNLPRTPAAARRTIGCSTIRAAVQSPTLSVVH